MGWSGFTTAWEAGWQDIFVLRLLGARTGIHLDHRRLSTLYRWLIWSLWPVALLLVLKLVSLTGVLHIYKLDWITATSLAVVNLGMFGAANNAWRYALRRSHTIDEFLATSPDRDSIVRPIHTGLRPAIQFILPVIFAVIPPAILLYRTTPTSLSAIDCAVTCILMWSMFLYGNVTWWLLVPPILVWRIRKSSRLNCRWHDPARTPGIRTFVEGYANTGIYLGLGAIGVIVTRIAMPRSSALQYFPALYLSLFLTSLWIGLGTQLALFLTIRRAKLEQLDYLAVGLNYPQGSAAHWEQAANKLTIYSAVAGSSLMPYSTSTVLQVVTALGGALAGSWATTIHF